MYAGYLVALSFVPRLRARWAIAAIVAVHAIFLLAPPLALTDVFNYINYGRMEVVHHLNPYTTIPIAEPHGDPAFQLSNWHELLSHMADLCSRTPDVRARAAGRGRFVLGDQDDPRSSQPGNRTVLAWKCARLLGRDPVAAIVLVGLNPIVLVWGLGGDHNDFLMVLLITLSPPAAALGARASPSAAASGGSAASNGSAASEGAAASEYGARSRGAPLAHACVAGVRPVRLTEHRAGAAFVTAAAIKASGGVLIPVVLAGLLRAPRRLTQVLLGMFAGAIVCGGASLLAFGLHLPDLSTQSWLVTSVSVPT